MLPPMLRRKPTTSNADELDAVPASAEGTPLHWTPFLSVGSKREDLQSMLEIFLGRSIDSRKFDLWSNCFFSLAHSTGRHEWFARTSWHARTTHNRPARPMHAAVPDREFIILTRPKRNPPPHVCSVNRAPNRVTTALGARRFLGLPLRNATCLLASTPRSSAFNQLWRWGPVVRSRLSSSSWSAQG